MLLYFHLGTPDLGGNDLLDIKQYVKRLEKYVACACAHSVISSSGIHKSFPTV